MADAPVTPKKKKKKKVQEEVIITNSSFLCCRWFFKNRNFKTFSEQECFLSSGFNKGAKKEEKEKEEGCCPKGKDR